MAQEWNIVDRVEIMPKSESYVTYKDHKVDFVNKQQTRLLNPNKTNMGKVSKRIIQNINDGIRSKFAVQQWRSTTDVIKWFNSLENKERGTFIKFDMENFYPNTTEELLKNSISWAVQFIEITPEDKKIILATKQNLLYSENQAWTKKNESKCDVTMGSWDGAEACELVGLFILSKLHTLNINLGLYRDDGVAMTTQRPQQVES